jgi:hypothetical protein
LLSSDVVHLAKDSERCIQTSGYLQILYAWMVCCKVWPDRTMVKSLFNLMCSLCCGIIKGLGYPIALGWDLINTLYQNACFPCIALTFTQASGHLLKTGTCVDYWSCTLSSYVCISNCSHFL